MIKQLTVNNFQSHKKSELNFDTGLNVIIGNSDSGKTALIRAINKLITNRPLGNDFQSNWGGDTVIKIATETDEISLIITDKARDKSYVVNDIEFKAFGTDVPEEIKQALNFTDINIQSQFDRPFLLDLSPGEVATHFNRIAHIDQIDTATKRVNSWINNIQSVIGHESEKNRPASGLIRELNEAEEQLKAFQDIEKIEIDLDVLENMANDWQNKINRMTSIKSLIEQIKRIDQQIIKQLNIVQYESTVDEIIKLDNEYKQMNGLFDNISLIINRINTIQIKIDAKMNLIGISEDVDVLINLVNKRKSITDVKTNVQNQISSITNVNLSLKRKMSEIDQKQSIFNREMPDICPLCGK